VANRVRIFQGFPRVVFFNDPVGFPPCSSRKTGGVGDFLSVNRRGINKSDDGNCGKV
jgi:hypothetical protein